jgi:hypothetical protein
MFEELQKEEQEEKEERNKTVKITAIIVGILVVVALVVYLGSRGHANTAQSAQPAPAAAAAGKTPADAVKDLQIVRAVMGKDPTGIRVMWSVQLKNKSSVYTYSDIQYEARFIGVDGGTLSASRDVIKSSIGPGEEKKFPNFMGGVYDANASTYQFVIVSATSSVQ